MSSTDGATALVASRVTDSGSGGVSARASRRRRAVGHILAMAPFSIYTILGLGVPAVAVVILAFKSGAGSYTLSNLDTVIHPPYSTGFKNSVILSAETAVVPGVLGVFIAYAIHTSKNSVLRRIVATASGVLANFGGINLTFMFLATLGSTGLITVWLTDLGWNPWDHGFNLFSMNGVAIVYLYFQLPLMVLVITPALAGLRLSWREAAENLGASSLKYWLTVGIPVLFPSVLGGMLLLFGSSFAAYATAETLTAGSIALTPIQIGDILNGNVIAGQTPIAYALGLGMLVILAATMICYGLMRRRASRWLR